ncbi:MAG TPA: isoprenylcysteine carboxylmethyltransferase family protein, partial [Burkholderiales bacterium]|nr:isoprenylcysteine carboxylmethyltransferase family protein [Burkholderiales bacterium]
MAFGVMQWLEHRIPPPIVAVCTAVLMLAAAWALPILTVDIPLAAPVAILVASAGAGISLAGVVQFLRARTTVNPLQPSAASALVSGGVYRWTRNPMYLGMAAVLLGWAIYLSNLAALAMLPLFIFYMNRFQIGPEERALEAGFGDEF